MNTNWYRAFSILAVGATLIVILLLFANAFATPAPDKIVLLVNDSKAGTSASMPATIAYGTNPPPDWINTVIACQSACKVTDNTENGGEKVVFSTLPAGVYIVYTYNGTWYALDVESGTTVATNTTGLYCANTAGCTTAYVIINDTNGGVAPFEANTLQEIGEWRDKVLNATQVYFVADSVPVDVNYTYYGVTDNYQFTSTTTYEYLHVLPPTVTLFVSGLAGNKTITVPPGSQYIVYSSNLSITDLKAVSNSGGTVTVTFTIKDEYGNNLTAHVEIKNATMTVFTGDSTTPVTLNANTTYYVTVSLTGYKTKTFSLTPTENTNVLVTLEKEEPAYYYVTFKVYDADTEDEITGATIRGDSFSGAAFKQIRITGGNHFASVSASGYKTAYITFTISGNATIPVYLAKTGSASESGFTKPSNVSVTDVNNKTDIQGGWGIHVVNLLNKTVNVEVYVRVGVNTGFGMGADIKLSEITLNAYQGWYYTYTPPKPSPSANIYFTIVVNGKPYATVRGVFNDYVEVKIESENSNWWGGSVITPNNTNPFGGWGIMGLIGVLIVVIIILRFLDEL